MELRPLAICKKTPSVPPALNADSTYTVVVNPGMGPPEYFTLRGNPLVKSSNEYGDDVCWGQLNVPGQNNPASVRVDCKSGQFLPMISGNPVCQELIINGRLPVVLLGTDLCLKTTLSTVGHKLVLD